MYSEDYNKEQRGKIEAGNKKKIIENIKEFLRVAKKTHAILNAEDKKKALIENLSNAEFSVLRHLNSLFLDEFLPIAIEEAEKFEKEHPNCLERANEIMLLHKVAPDEAWVQFQIEFRIGIYAYHAKNIDKTVDKLNKKAGVVDNEDDFLMSSENKEDSDLLDIVKSKFNEVVKDYNLATGSRKMDKEVYTEFMEMIIPEVVKKLYYGNELTEFVSENIIEISGKKIELDRDSELAKFGARAYRMRIEANRAMRVKNR